ncbi:MAG: GNAT family N-acetyltransferase [Erysipelotrichaceae bacterium]|nr:GNAT family N-acetyltransferase [Erysipelotrichaceae bacterium]
MIDISRLSHSYDVRRLDENDTDDILEICQGNSQFYLYCEAKPDREQVQNDMHITPPGKDLSSKFYIGFFQKNELIAVMDMIDGYPQDDIVYIGFFMMKKEYQGKEIGSSIISETANYLKELGYQTIRLGIDKENPQSNHFWKKNGFEVIQETDRNGWMILIGERKL